MTAMAEVTLPNLIAAGFLKAPLELERTYKGVKLTAMIEQTLPEVVADIAEYRHVTGLLRHTHIPNFALGFNIL